MSKIRSVSVVMPTFNSIRTIESCLKSVRGQDYSAKQNTVEIVAADGGSSDGTLEILKKYGCRVIKEKSGSSEKAKAVALRQVKSELVLLMASDNVLPSEKWLKEMVSSLEKYPEAVASYSLFYQWRNDDGSLNRYFSLLGANDPVAWFMGRADKKGWVGKKNGESELVEFSVSNMPTLGDNGFLIKRKELMKARVDEDHFFHIDVILDLVGMRIDKFVEVKNEIFHDTGEEYFSFVKKRWRYMKELYLGRKKFRRFVWVRDFRDLVILIGFIIYSITLIGPILKSIAGYIRKPDLAWFWHPVMCVTMVVIYGKAVLKR